MQLNVPVDKVGEEDDELNDHKNNEHRGVQARLHGRTGGRLWSKSLGSDTDVPLDHIESFLDLVDAVLNVIVTDWLSRALLQRLLFALVLNDRCRALVYLSNVAPFIK